MSVEADYSFVRGDSPTVSRTLTEDGSPIDLTGVSEVRFVMRHYAGAKVVDAPADIASDPTTGEVSYTLDSTETSRSGNHDAEWVIDRGTDGENTKPAEKPVKVYIRPDVESDDAIADPLPEDATVDVLTANGFDGSITGDSSVESLVDANLAVDANGNLFAPETASQLTDEEVQDIVGAFVSGGTNATVTYDDSNDVLTVSATDTDTQLTDEEVQDVVGAFVSGGTNVTVSYDDSGNSLVVSADHDHSGDTLGTASSRVTTAHIGTTDTEELSVTETYLGRLADTPTDSEIETGNVALYFKQGSDTLYKRPYGGTETAIGGSGGSSPWSDSDGDDLYEQDLDGIEVPTAKVSDVATAASVDDGLNYLDPSWLALTEAIVSVWPTYPPKDLLTIRSGGSGSINLNPGQIVVRTGTTQDSAAQVYEELRSKQRKDARITPTWDKRRTFVAEGQFQTAAGHERVGMGILATGGYEQICVGTDNGDIVGICNDGSSKSTATLQSGVSTPHKLDIHIEWYPNDRAEFYDWATGTKLGEVTSSLPSGEGSDARNGIMARAQNPNSATNRGADIGGTRFIQHP